jgi:hypothetical protein
MKISPKTAGKVGYGKDIIPWISGTIYFTYADTLRRPTKKRLKTLFFESAGSGGLFGLFRGWRRGRVRQMLHGVLESDSVQSYVYGFWHFNFTCQQFTTFLPASKAKIPIRK